MYRNVFTFLTKAIFTSVTRLIISCRSTFSALTKWGWIYAEKMHNFKERKSINVAVSDRNRTFLLQYFECITHFDKQ